MSRRIGEDAFAYYLSLGTDRSYEKVAAKYGVAKRSVTRLATRERWQEKAASIRDQAHAATEKKAKETIEQVQERHLKLLRMMQARAYEALKSMPLTSAVEAARVIALAIDRERILLGEPSDRTAVSIAEVVERESKRWLLPPTQEDHGADNGLPVDSSPEATDREDCGDESPAHL